MKGDILILLHVVHNSKMKVNLRSITSESVLLGILLAIVGGFLDAYTFIGRGGVFSNAQTGNIVLVGVYAFNKNWTEALNHALPIFAFIIGVMAAQFIKNNVDILPASKWEHFVLISEIIILSIIGFMPHTISNGYINITISFVTSLQFCSFKKLADYPYATTMCTGNLRSASEAAYAAITKKDHEAAVKAIHYYSVILFFLIGAFLGGFLTYYAGDKSIWGASLLLLLSLILLLINEEEIAKEELNEEKIESTL